MSLLQDLYRGGWLRAVDHALGESLRRLRPDTPDAVLAAAALCSRALAQGHSQLPLSQVRELLLDIAPEREVLILPPIDEWLAMLRASPWCLSDLVGTGVVGAGMTAIPSESASPQAGVRNVVTAEVGMVMPAPTKAAPTGHELTPLILERDALSLRRYWHYEVRLADAIRTRLATPDHPPVVSEARIAQLFPDAIGANRAQADAARALLSRHFLLLTGGPGTGKTTTVARALVLFAENFSALVGADLVGAGMTATPIASATDFAVMPAPTSPAPTGNHPRIALAAPTGKAAARLAESVRESLAQLVAAGTITSDAATHLSPDAKTLHRLLGWRPDGTDFRHDAAHPLAADLIIVDEASMIDLPMMCKLVEAVAPSATLLLIGDRDQLPSVETGDVLAALSDAADALADAGIVGAGMTANSLGSESRQADVRKVVTAEVGMGMPAPTNNGSEHRVHLTYAHRQRADIDVASLAALVRDGHVDAALSGLAIDAFRGVSWRDGGDRTVGDAVLAAALPAFRRIAAAPDIASALEEAKQFRVLTAVREGPAGNQTLNAQIAAALDPSRRGSGFFHGRLVLITENSYRHGLFNGDIGIAWREDIDAAGAPVEPTLRVWFDADGGPRAWLPAALPAHESAFALTVHKSQGSEFERVFLALPERGARPVSRELLYTGLTRCRQAVTVWATEQTLRDGIARRAQRWSGLAARLTGA